ncbi:glycosyltransferase family 61 protein [Azospirillum sp. TSO22-1]|uniref:glycosyltransferase family 61 protein n=1 Tax=Azospirillum sp. TSO22-1 TaxID=716789 RepID=UPI001304DFFB|nr:glycosyltransferase family 61 protein [Azospirillum sp. TSO22-1]
MHGDQGLSDGGIWHPTGRGTVVMRAAYASIEQRGARLARLAPAPLRLPPGYGAATLDPALFRLCDVVALPTPGDWRFLTGDGHLVLGGVAVWPAKPAGALNPGAPLEERVFHVELEGMPAAVEEECLWLGGPSPANYYHWVIDTLPRLLALRACEELWEGRRLLACAALAGYMRESLDLLGVPMDALLPVAGPTWLRSVCVVSNLSSYGYVHPVALAALRNAFLPLVGGEDGGDGEGRRILVLRGDAARRRLRNEAEVAAWAASRGFAAVSLAGMGFLEQVRLFRRARIVLGAHGAGLTNLAWAPPERCALIELTSGAPSLNHFQRLAGRLRIPYRRVAAAGAADRDADFTADLDALECALAGVEGG